MLGIVDSSRQTVRLARVLAWCPVFIVLSCAVSFDNWPDPITASTGGKPSTGGIGAASGGATSSPSGGGGSNPAGGSPTGGNRATGGSNATGGAASQSIVWLTLEDDQAKSTSSPNDSLGINGQFYAYSDSCASYVFNPLTRCVSGTLCDVGSSFENWGVAIGFDFVNTGSTGVPANAKLTWNPNDHNAVGVAWQISNLVTTRLQLWVLDMDPSFQGVCTSDTCSIQGPPDGNGQITADGTLYFNSMVKDDWGGSGIAYTFSPAAVYSLQFKIPTIITGAESFEFCIDRLGIIATN